MQRLPFPDYDPSEPPSAMYGIPIQENGEPLIDFVEAGLRQDRPRFTYRRERLGRQGLVERLLQADRILRFQGYGLLILECWRAPLIQKRMFMAVEAQLRPRFPDASPEEFRKIVEQYSAPLDDDAPPPHVTGGAVDLWLADADGNAVDLHTPFDWQDHAGFSFDAEGLSPEARANRDRMGDALSQAGLTNYASEYWHWSYGDQGWAYRGQHSAALYGAIEPEGWKPAPEDDIDAPLEFKEDADPQQSPDGE